MRRMLPALIAVASAMALAILLAPPSSTAELAPAQTPTVASYLPIVLRPLPPPASPTPTQSGPTATPTPTLPPPTFNNCQDDPNPNAAPDYPMRIVAIDKEREIVWLWNMSTSAVGLDGWHMCSITGNQLHPIGGSDALAPGEVRSFTNGGGPIWNNSSRDDGALYNPNGQLVSYWFD